MNAAKFVSPRLPGTLPRPRLFALCDRTLADAPALWIDGAAGSGKTRLMCSYAAQCSRPLRWLNADAGDRDPVTFFDAMTRLAEGASLPNLAVERAFDLDNFARRFFRAWFAESPPGTLLILDDWPAGNGKSADVVFSALIDQIPVGSHAVVLSRTAPGPGLARHELHGRLGRIEAPALAFTPEEVRELAAHLKFDASGDTPPQVVAATGGWAMGVHLLLQKRPGSRDSPLSSGVLGMYLEQEVLARMNDVERRVLTDVCLVHAFDEADLPALTDHPLAGNLLRHIAQRTGLLIATAPEGTGFRLPALFREALRERARQQLSPAAFAALAARSAEALAAADRTVQAFDLLQSDGDRVTLPAFVLRYGKSLLDTGRTATLGEWLAALAAEAFDDSPRLRLWRGVCRSYLAPREALADIAEAYRCFSAADDTAGAFEAAVAAVESGLAQVHDLPALDPWIEALAATIDAARTDAERLRGWYALTYAAQCRKPGQPRVREGVAWMRNHAHRTPDPDERLLCGVALIFHACVAADHVLGQEIIDLVAPRLTEDMSSPVTRWLWHYWRGLYHLWRIEYPEATREWEVSVKLCDTHGLKALEYVILANVVMVDLAEDRLTDARRHLDIIDAAFTGTESMARAFFWLGEMFYRFAVKDHPGTREAMDHFLRSARTAGLFCLEMLALTDVAALQLIDGNVDAAETLVREARERTSETVIRHCEGQITGVEASIAYVRGKRDEARTLFSRTLDLIGHKGTCGCLLWVRSGLSVLFSEAWQAGERPALLRELIRRHQVPPPTSFTRPWPWPVTIRALGALEIRTDDRLWQPDGKPQHRVLDFLRYLVAEGAYEVSAERIADALWPASEGDAAMTNVRGTVKRLRELLGHPDTVRVFDGKVGLNPRLVWTDTRALRELVDALDQGQTIEAPDGRVDTLLFDLYRAPLLEAEHDVWLEAARHRQRRHFARAIAILVRQAREAGDEACAADLIERALVRDPDLRRVEGIGPTDVGQTTGFKRFAS